MGLAYKKEKFTEIMDELPELFYAHWDENEEDKDTIPLVIDWQRYVNTENVGILHIITARDDDKLVGYFFAYVQPTTHHKTTILAASDGFYLKPEYRKGMAGASLIKHGMKMARDLGAKKIYIVVKAGSLLARLLTLMKFKASEETYSCLL